MVLLVFVFSSRRRHTRCALVTGVQTCALPISEGAQVMINGFGDAAEIEKERAALEKTSGKALYDAADMTKPDEIAAMVQRCHDELGGPDIVIAKAGIQHVARIEDFPPEKFEAINRNGEAECRGRGGK